MSFDHSNCTKEICALCTQFRYVPCPVKNGTDDAQPLAMPDDSISFKRPEQSKELVEAIKNCPNCQDESYPEKYAHYGYTDRQEPLWTCFSHPDNSRKWVGILNPQWIVNMRKSKSNE